MPPVWMQKSIDQMTAAECRETLNDPRAPDGLKDAAGTRLAGLQEVADRSARAYSDRVRDLAAKSKKKPKGNVDRVSVRQAVQNAAGGGGLVLGGLSAKAVIDGYDQVKSSGLFRDLWAAVQAADLSDKTLVYLGAVVAVVFLGTLLWKMTKEY